MKRDFVKKLICYAAVTTTLTTTLPVGVYAATWVNDSMGNYYFYENNSYAVGWRNIDGSVYYFDGSGMMQKGWMKYGDSWYYLDTNTGALKTGWINYNGEWYYSDSAGIMQTGVLQINGQTYCFGNNGAMKRGSIIINNQFYTIGSNGALISNKLPVPDKIFDSNNNCINQLNSNSANVTDPNGSKYDNPIIDQSEEGDYDEPVRKFTVTFRDENGQELKTKKVKDGDTVKMYEPDDESDEDRDFIEWNTKRDGSGKSYDDDEKVKVTKDLTLYAIWEEVEEKTEVSNISISGESEVEVGKSIQLTADVKPSDATNTKVKWSIVSSTEAGAGKATINSDGVLSGVEPGKITVKAESADESKVSTTKEFTVVAAKTLITGITITADTKEITEDGGTLKLKSNISPESASNKNLHWKIIEGNECADINDDGELKAIKNGKIKVQAVSRDGSGISSNIIEITISGQSVKAAKIIVSGYGNKKKVSAGSDLIMTARILPDDVSDSNSDVEWEAKYTSGSNSGKPVEITSITESEAMNGDVSDNNDGHKYKYARLKADSKGKIEVIARSKKDNSIVGKTTITAVKDVEKISITASDIQGNLTNSITNNAGKLSLKAIFIKDDNSNSIDTETDTTSVKWGIEDITDGHSSTTDSAVTATSCDKASISTSSKSAVITAFKDGKVRVYAIANDETKTTAYIDIDISGQVVKVTSITLTKENGDEITDDFIDIKKGETVSIIAKVDDKATSGKVLWSLFGDKDNISYVVEPYDETTRENKITIKADKNLTKETSTISIKAFADDTVKECNLRVTDNVTGILFEYNPSSLKIVEGQSIDISAVLYPTYMNGQNITWSVEAGSSGQLLATETTYRNNISTQKFVAQAPGQVKVKAEHSEGYSAITDSITILNKITALEIGLKNPSDSSSLILEKNSSKELQLKAIVKNALHNDPDSDANANGEYNQFIDWSIVSNDSNLIATIDSTGKLTVTRGGEEIPEHAKITVKADSKSSNIESQVFEITISKAHEETDQNTDVNQESSVN